MKKYLPLCLIAFILIIPVVLSQDSKQISSIEKIAGWGIEDSVCGSQYFYLKLNSGSQTYIDEIQGDVSASPQPPSAPSVSILRNSLSAIWYGGMPNNTISTWTIPGQISNNAAESNPFQIIVKSFNFTTTHIPFDIKYSTPLNDTNGTLKFRIMQNSFTKYGLANSTYDCLDTEYQMIIFYH